jgi:ribosomal protein L11 methyltransferase
VATPTYPFVAIDVPASLASVAADQLFELGAEGVEQRDDSTLVRGAQSQGPIVDHGADIGQPVAQWDRPSASAPEDEGQSEIVTLVAAFSTREAALQAIEAFDDELNPRLEEVVGDAWRDAWKEHFEPFRLSPHLVIRPPWREAPASLVEAHPDTIVLELEPGRAFGTGLHETTSLVASVLDDHRATLAGPPAIEVLDVGCGSGILAIAAIALGAKSARAVDIDPDAVTVTLENARRAGVEARVHADTTDMRDLPGQWSVVLANIQAEVLVPRAADLIARVQKGGLLVLSGILVTQRDTVLAAYSSLKLESSPTRGEWVALVLRA